MRTTKCKYCGAEIFYAQTSSGRPMPLDAKPEKPAGKFTIGHAADGTLNCVSAPQLYMNHWTTCPKAAEVRADMIKAAAQKGGG